MTLESLNIAIAMPEIFLLIAACLVLVVDVYLPEKRRNVSYVLAQLSLIITLVLVLTNQTDTRVLAFMICLCRMQWRMHLNYSF